MHVHILIISDIEESWDEMQTVTRESNYITNVQNKFTEETGSVNLHNHKTNMNKVSISATLHLVKLCPMEIHVWFTILKPLYVYHSAQAAITKYNRLGGLHKSKLFFHTSGDQVKDQDVLSVGVW